MLGDRIECAYIFQKEEEHHIQKFENYVSLFTQVSMVKMQLNEFLVFPTTT